MALPCDGTCGRGSLIRRVNSESSLSDNRLYLPESDPRKLGRLRSKLLVAESSRLILTSLFIELLKKAMLQLSTTRKQSKRVA